MLQYARIKGNVSLLIFPCFVSLQGDEMKKIGMQPIPMMDRDKKDEVPQGQVRTALLLTCAYSPRPIHSYKVFKLLHSDGRNEAQTF